MRLAFASGYSPIKVPRDADRRHVKMADKEASKRSPTPPERIKPEDPDTAAARKELDNTVISDKPGLAVMPSTRADPATSKSEEVQAGETPPPTGDLNLDAEREELKEQISSPKKKRAHAEVDDPNADPAEDANGDVSPIGASGNASANRTDRSEPEKKRHRDISSETKPDKAATVVS